MRRKEGEALKTKLIYKWGRPPRDHGMWLYQHNDTAMKVIGAELGFDGRLRQGRCLGHTLNLLAKALLFGKNANVFKQQLSGTEALSDT